VWFALLLFACGGAKTVAVQSPPRAATPGDELLALVPEGADAVLEIDLRRLRENAVVGPLARSLGLVPMASADWLGLADALLIATYGLGDRVEHLFVVRAPKGAVPDAVEVAQGVVALATEERIDAVKLTKMGVMPSMATSHAFLAVRAAPMPARADGAVLRATAVLGFAARVDVSRRFEVEAVPTAFAVWGDVVDDLAIVTHLHGKDETEAKELARSVEQLRARVAKASLAFGLVFRGLVKAAQVDVAGPRARIVVVLGPKRLANIVALLLRSLGNAS